MAFIVFQKIEITFCFLYGGESQKDWNNNVKLQHLVNVVEIKITKSAASFYPDQILDSFSQLIQSIECLF